MIPLLHLGGPAGGRVCGAQYGESSWFAAKITCPECLVLLDEMQVAGLCEVIHPGLTYVKWAKTSGLGPLIADRVATWRTRRIAT